MKSGLADKYWPVYSALDAYFNGEEKLLDVNPEVRGAASMIFHSLLGIKRMRNSNQIMGKLQSMIDPKMMAQLGGAGNLMGMMKEMASNP